MDLKHFGDAYDIVKKSLLEWLAAFGPWGVHPMFTHKVTSAEAAAFSRLLGAPLLSTEVLRLDSDRTEYFAACGDCRSIFLDPDTGLRLHRRQRHRSTEFVFADELAAIVNERPNGLVMTFDQSLPRGDENAKVRSKLDHFVGHGVAGFAYVSQVCFLVLGQSTQIVNQARKDVLDKSGLPKARIVTAASPNSALHAMARRIP